MNAPVYALCAAIGFACAWGIQSTRWNLSDAEKAVAMQEEISKQATAATEKIEASMRSVEEARKEYLEHQKNAKSEIDDLERRIADGSKRLYVKAKCPAVPATAADASRAGSGTAELDATATRAYFAIERGLAEQYSLLQLCRRELRNRSAQKAP